MFILGEGVLIYCVVFMASFFFLAGHLPLKDLLELIWLKVFLVALVTQFSLYFNDLYHSKNGDNVVDLAARLIQSIGMASIALAIIYFLLPDVIIGRWIFPFSIAFLLIFLISWRFLYSFIIKKRLLTEKAIMVGSGALAKDIIQEINDRTDTGYDIRCIVFPERTDASQIKVNGIRVLYGFHNVCDLAETVRPSSIIVALEQKRGLMPYNELLNCKTMGISIIDGETFYEQITGKLMLDKIRPSWFIFSDGFAKSEFSRLTKRLVGLVMSSILLIVFSPFMLLTIIAIKLDSRGPVFYSQQRVGENEKPFTLYKFRSMEADAEKECGPVWTCDGDPRITRIGKVIRRLHIDEWPQLWNVFKGDLSFVGPRPERPFFVEKLKTIVPYYKERFTVKPGATGWAQVQCGYAASVEDALEKLKYDLYYIKNMSFLMDLVIIFHTIKIVLLGRGAR
jgi:sugar transferase (PEP-CTERM system associated)